MATNLANAINGPKSQRQLHAQSSDLAVFEQVVQRWFCAIAPGVGLEAVMLPQFWVHHARLLKKNNTIFCKAEDGAWAAELLVESDGGPEVLLKKLWYVDLDDTPAEQTATGAHVIKWCGPHALFCIVNSATNQVIKDKLYPKAVAAEFLRDNFGVKAN